MRTTAGTIRKRLRGLVSRIPQRELYAAQRYLEFLASQQDDPVLRAIENAPPDDEPLTAEDHEALKEAYEAIKRGEVVSHEEVRRILLGGSK